MAKKRNDTHAQRPAQVAARIARTEAYAEKIRRMFAATVNEILELNKRLPVLPAGEMFSFDTHEKTRVEVERIIRQLHSVATLAIEKGISVEWDQANAEADKLVTSLFGKKTLDTPQVSAMMQRNEAAMAAFIARSERGLNLSSRVWQSCRQLRDEMEVAITVAVGDGTSAASMSRRVRQYLNDPDLMFRRFRYKDENGKWKRKWKKRVIDPETGRVKYIDYDRDSYIPKGAGANSRGVYKSAAKNAMRVARSETNIAYRRADHERMSQLDFVLGQRIQLSHNHPVTDICDDLAGDYPKDFVFDEWHPQCFCFVTPILVDPSEIQKMNEAVLQGKEYTPRGKRITDYPQGFKDWVKDHKKKLTDPKTSLPYFIANNRRDVQRILRGESFTAPPKKTPLEIAKERHDARTPEQEEAIRLAWQERRTRIDAQNEDPRASRMKHILKGEEPTSHELNEWEVMSAIEKHDVLRRSKVNGLIRPEQFDVYPEVLKETEREKMLRIVDDVLRNRANGYDMEDENHYLALYDDGRLVYTDELNENTSKLPRKGLIAISGNEGLSEPRYWAKNDVALARLLERADMQEVKDGEIIGNRIVTNLKLFKKYSADPLYSDVKFDEKSGGMKATHKGHNKSSEEETRFFSTKNHPGYTGKELEIECQRILYQNGYSCILMDESTSVKIGEVLPALDSITNGKYMDIRSITANNKSTIHNAIKSKAKQIKNVRKKTNIDSHSLIIYLHDRSMGDFISVQEAFRDYQKHGSTIKEIICVLGYENRVVVIK